MLRVLNARGRTHVRTKGSENLKIFSLAARSIKTDSPAHSPMLSATPRPDTTGGFFSKPQTYVPHYDSVARNPHAKDLAHVYSLLETCLLRRDWSRVHHLLKNLYESLGVCPELLNAVNKYLFAYSQQQMSSIKEIEDMLGELAQEMIGLKGNSYTYAILVRRAIQDESREEVEMLMNKYLRGDRNRKRSDLLHHPDVLGVRGVKELVDMFELEESEIPVQFRELIRIARKEAEQESSETLEGSAGESIAEQETAASEDTVSLEKSDEDWDEAMPASLDNGMEELTAVDTFGMKVIRKALSSLKYDRYASAELKDSLEIIEEEALNYYKDDKVQSIDFFSIYKSLSGERQTRFENALDLLNFERQRAVELKSREAAHERWKHDFQELKTMGVVSVSKSLNTHLWKWHEDMLTLLNSELKRIKDIQDRFPSSEARFMPGKRAVYNPKHGRLTAEEKELMIIAPYLSALKPEKITVTTILELLRMFGVKNEETDGVRTARAVLTIGKAIEMEFRSEQIFRSEYHLARDLKSKRHTAEFHRALTSSNMYASSDTPDSWPQDIRAKLGSLLIAMLLQVARVPVSGTDPDTGEKVYGTAPAFYHGYIYQQGTRLGVVNVHKSLLTKLSTERVQGALQPQLLPMLTMPRLWSTTSSGGYLFSKSTLVRTKDSPEQVAYVKAASEQRVLDEVYKGLDVLGQTQWTVNRRVLDVIIKIWNTGKEMLAIPPLIEELKLPDVPARDCEPRVRRDWLRTCKEMTNFYQSTRSQRCDLNYKLEIARALVGEKFYFPHNLDFRGRAYPITPHLNHLGNDVARSLLMFWKGKPLGDVGYDWIRVHLANLFGFDKQSLKARIEFVDEHVEDIKASAEDPLVNTWWQTADKPWQALAVCQELADAWKLEDPRDFVSHVSVHQDGTCNGLQHYAALGGDIVGAKQVNLVPSEKPQDVYSHVSRLVQEKVDKDAAAGVEEAIMISGHVSRKLVKQTVMTSVYGVTYVGARLQIQSRLKDIGIFDRLQMNQISRYVTTLIFDAIRESFEGAHKIQDWLGECARLISKSVSPDAVFNATAKSRKTGSKVKNPEFMASVIWTSPMGLPVVQPYRDVAKKQVDTNLQTVFISDPYAMSPVNSRKQQSAFPPNFIHSLDASHMLMSAIECGKQDIQFAAVHDSYWTHACDVDKMNKILRDCFVELHEVDLIQKLKDEFERRYEGYLRVVFVSRASELAARLKVFREELHAELGRAPNFEDELRLEAERQRLLKSDNEADREKGRNMETTVSIAEKYEVQEFATFKLKKQRVNMYTSSEDRKAGAYDESADVDRFVERKYTANTGTPVLVPLKFPPIPPKGSFDVKVVRDSAYFFS